MCVVQIINIYKEKISCCEEFKGEFVSTNHIFRKGTSTKLRAYAKARTQEMSQGGESIPSVYPFAMDKHKWVILRYSYPSFKEDSFG